LATLWTPGLLALDNPLYRLRILANLPRLLTALFKIIL
jgi:hypothetical protein